MTDVHEQWMRQALDLAAQAFDVDEVPVGAVVVADGELIGSGFNRPIGNCDPTAHAEMVAIRDAAAHTGNYRLSGATLYVTVEPCNMCAGALIHARIDLLVFGAHEPRAGAIESTTRVLENSSLNHRLSVVAGVLAAESAELLQRFFESKRV
ncbi:MAG: tRNA adenosine(34) deaminase TadA [Gammaproteobacteria bacterium]|nr:tRNA adenosine(34) deaminase TadA [Gammaproteobacteria bacterium]